MSPGYVAFLLPFIALSSSFARNILIVGVQTILSLLSIFLLYRFTEKYFSRFAAISAALCACFFPDFIYSVLSFSPTVIYHCLVLCLLLVLSSYEPGGKSAKPLLIGLIGGCLIYFRSEFLIFMLLFISLIILGGHRKEAAIVFFLTAALLAPWSIRSSAAVGKFIPLSSGSGLNFYRGHNPDFIGSFGGDDIKKKIADLPHTSTFEASMDQFYRQEAMNFMRQHPVQDLLNYPAKLFHLWIFNDRETHRNVLPYCILSWFIFIFFLAGFFPSFSWQKHKYTYILFIYSTLIALVFFTLPRHQTMMRIMILPFIGAGIEYIWQKIKEIAKSRQQAS